ncbi:MAG: hypothetical protein WD000_01980 [Thermodesulfobacteriota bacterium]
MSQPSNLRALVLRLNSFSAKWYEDDFWEARMHDEAKEFCIKSTL